MKVLVDTSVWSLALRRRAGGGKGIRQIESGNMEQNEIVKKLAWLIQES